MRIKEIALIAIIALGLGACNEQNQRIELSKTLLQVDSQLPDVPAVSPVVLNKVVFDFPRDMAVKMVKKTPACTARTDVATADFVMKCTYYPILRKSNLFIGMDQPNFTKLNQNLDALIAQNQKLESRIKEVNRQRAEARGEAPISTNPAINNMTINQTLVLSQ